MKLLNTHELRQTCQMDVSWVLSQEKSTTAQGTTYFKIKIGTWS